MTLVPNALDLMVEGGLATAGIVAPVVANRMIRTGDGRWTVSSSHADKRRRAGPGRRKCAAIAAEPWLPL